MQSHYELTIRLTADDDALLDVLACFVAAGEIAGEVGVADVQLPLVLAQVVVECDRYGCPACTTPLC